MNIDEKVLAAFGIEHKEQLEGIRALLAGLESGAALPESPQIEEAFRLAHSLKGGARVCALKNVETLGHRLETVFDRVRKGELHLDRGVSKAVNTVLDAIEDWMDALLRNEPACDTAQALAAISHVLDGTASTSPADSEDDDLTRRLRAAFDSEYQTYITGIRAFLFVSRETNGTPPQSELEEAFRMAHSLKGAAHIVGLPTVEAIARRLESLLSRARDGQLAIDDHAKSLILKSLDCVEREVQRNEHEPPDPRSTAALAELEALLEPGNERNYQPPGASPRLDAGKPDASACRPIPDPERESESTASRPLTATSASPPTTDHGPRTDPPITSVDTVRVSTESLDRLLYSSGELLAESMRQDRVARELNQLCRLVGEMERERQSVRRVAAASLHRLSSLPEYSRIAGYLDFVERQSRQVARQMGQVRRMQQQSSWLLRNLGEQVQRDVKRARMVPAESIFQGFRKMVRELARDVELQVELQTTGLDVRADRMVLQALKDPLMHILRNAVIHGIERPRERAALGKSETGRIELKLETRGNRLEITVDDDGRGIDFQKVAEAARRRGLISDADHPSPEQLGRLIFQPGFSTSKMVTELSGRGMGLSVVQHAVARMQGEVSVVSRETVQTTSGAARGGGSRFVISVPLALSASRLLLVSCRGQTFALPLANIDRLMRMNMSAIKTVEGQPVVDGRHTDRTTGGQPVALTSLARILGMDEAGFHVDHEMLFIAVLKSGTSRIAIAVDGFVSERDSLIKNLDGPAARAGLYSGGIVLEDGSVALVVDAQRIIEKMQPTNDAPSIRPSSQDVRKQQPTVLVVDDSFTTRTLEKNILEAHGYQVRVAVDGIEALSQLASDQIDLVISDVQMPRMDGFSLLEEIKRSSRMRSIPVILVTSMNRREDQERGLDLGADAYIVKQRFDHQGLLDTIRQIV